MNSNDVVCFQFASSPSPSDPSSCSSTPPNLQHVWPWFREQRAKPSEDLSNIKQNKTCLVCKNDLVCHSRNATIALILKILIHEDSTVIERLNPFNLSLQWNITSAIHQWRRQRYWRNGTQQTANDCGALNAVSVSLLFYHLLFNTVLWVLLEIGWWKWLKAFFFRPTAGVFCAYRRIYINLKPCLHFSWALAPLDWLWLRFLDGKGCSSWAQLPSGRGLQRGWTDGSAILREASEYGIILVT